MDYNINDIDGKSFFPFENQTSNEELISYLHTMPYEKPHPKDSVGIRTKKYKYFHSENSKKDVYLYDLENDPFENNNIVSEQPELVNKFNKIITDIEQKKLISNELEFSDGEEAMIKEELRKLGYI